MSGMKHKGMLYFDLGDPPAMIKLKSPNRTRGIVPKRLILILILTALIFTVGSGTVYAAVYIESTGPGGYGWQQLYHNTSGYNYKRLTGSSDREYYDYGYKPIQIYGRQEDYWSQDSGWWYVASPSLGYIRIFDNGSGRVYNNESLDLVKGTTYITYNWGSNTSGTEKPGRWTVYVNDSTENATFYVYVRGQLNVTSISNSSSPEAGSSVEVSATVKDHAGNTISSTTDNKPSVVMYVSGAGFYNESDMTAGASVWTANFTPSAPGDHYVTIKAGDGHTYWVDGRGSIKIPVTGVFPASFGGSGGSILKVILMILLALIIVEAKKRI